MMIYLPAYLEKISKDLPKELIAEGMLLAIKKRIREEKTYLKQAQKKIAKFEKKYKNSFIAFENEKNIQHEHIADQDWVEWSFWEKVYKKAKDDFNMYSKIYQSSTR